MDAEHRQFLDYQADSNRLSAAELELDVMLASAINSTPADTLRVWNPYGRADILREIREARFSELSIILFDLDGCADWPDDARKQEQLHSLIRESRQTLVDIVLGLPSIYTVMDTDESGKRVSRKAMMWDRRPKLEITVPEEVYRSMPIEPLIEPSDLTTTRFEWLDYRRWHLHEKGMIANAFLAFLEGEAAAPAPGISWITDAITSAAADVERIEQDTTDQVKEALCYLDMIEKLGWCGLASIGAMEKCLVDIARRVGYSN